MAKKLFYVFMFITLLSLVCCLLVSPRIGRLFYPFHYRDTIQSYAAAYNLDPMLVAAVIYTESGFRCRAVSERGARGLMQVMPSTAQWVAEQMGALYAPEMLFDVEYNIQIGCWYLADLYSIFGGETVVVLAAYNGGRGEVRRWLEQGIWDGTLAGLEQIPFSETRTFIMRVLEAHRKYRQIYD